MKWNAAEASILKQITRFIRRTVFVPAVMIADTSTPQTVTQKQVLNATGPEEVLLDALFTGKIEYSDGVFTGSFSSKISSALRWVGAKFDKRRAAYVLNPADCPPFVFSASASFKMLSAQAHQKIKEHLDDLTTSLDALIAEDPIDVDSSIEWMTRDYRDVAEQLAIRNVLSHDSIEALKRDYADRLSPVVKKFTADSIRSLRVAVDKNATSGARFTTLIDSIQTRYGVTKSRAELIAQTETSTFMSVFREKAFGESGVKRYRWQTAGDGRVRDEHQNWDGKIFYYSDPPVIDQASGTRGNPGQFPRCRCIDRPILD